LGEWQPKIRVFSQKLAKKKRGGTLNLDDPLHHDHHDDHPILIGGLWMQLTTTSARRFFQNFIFKKMCDHCSDDLENRRKHTASHVMTAAVRMIKPDIRLGVGPWTKEGFYQDFDFGDEPLSDKDFKKIEKKMRWICNKNFKIERKEFSEKESREIWKNDPFKLELIDGIVARGEQISAYDFVDESGRVVYRDICAGPHLASTGELKVFKLMKIAGAYWRGDETKPQLTRIYGVAFETPEELAAYEKMLEEAAKRDHRKLGKELELFAFDEEVGPGLPLWLPAGAVICEELEKVIFVPLLPGLG